MMKITMRKIFNPVERRSADPQPSQTQHSSTNPNPTHPAAIGAPRKRRGTVIEPNKRKPSKKKPEKQCVSLTRPSPSTLINLSFDHKLTCFKYLGSDPLLEYVFVCRTGLTRLENLNFPSRLLERDGLGDFMVRNTPPSLPALLEKPVYELLFFSPFLLLCLGKSGLIDERRRFSLGVFFCGGKVGVLVTWIKQPIQSSKENHHASHIVYEVRHSFLISCIRC